MADESAPRNRFAGMSERLEQSLVDDAGNAAPRELVTEVIEAKAAALEDAPVQEFVPLLVENQVRDELHQRGLKTDWSIIDDDQHDDGDDAVEGSDAT